MVTVGGTTRTAGRAAGVGRRWGRPAGVGAGAGAFGPAKKRSECFGGRERIARRREEGKCMQ